MHARHECGSLNGDAVPPFACNAEQLRLYAMQGRRLARRWADMAGKDPSPWAARLRVVAQLALSRVYEMDCLLENRGLPSSRFHSSVTPPAFPPNEAPWRIVVEHTVVSVDADQ